MNLEDSDDASIDVVSFGSFSVEDLDGETSTWNAEDGGLVEKVGKLFRVQCSTWNEQFKVRSETGDILLQNKNKSDGYSNYIFKL